MGCRSPVYVNYVSDTLLASDADGSVRTVVITPRRFWGLPLGMGELLVGLRVEGRETGFGVTLKWQWSLDGSRWVTGSTIGQERTTDGDFLAVFNAVAEKTPFGRVVAEVRDTGSASQKTATCSAWGYYHYA